MQGRAGKQRKLSRAAVAGMVALAGVLVDALGAPSALAKDRGDRGGGYRRDRGDDDDGRSGRGWQGGSNGGGWGFSNSNSSGGGGGSNTSGGNSSAGSSGNSNTGTSAGQQQQDQSGRGDKRDNDDSPQKAGTKSAAPAAGEAPDDGPPRTVIDVFKRVFQAPPPPAQPGHAQGGDNKSHVQRHGERQKWDAVVHRHHDGEKRRRGDKEKRKEAAEAARERAGELAASAAAAAENSSSRGSSTSTAKVRLPGGLPPVVVPEIASIKADVVLGVELGRAAMARLRELKFTVRGSSDVALGRLTELGVPEGLNAVSARELLSRELPGQTFTYSVRYRISPETDGRAAPTLPPDQPFTLGKASRPCESDRCYGSRLVSWQQQLSSCSKGVKVGVVDTAVDLEHPALAGMRSKLGSFGSGSVASARMWHGTGVAALLAGAPDSVTPGLVPSSDFLIADIFSKGEDGMPESDSVGLLRALHWLDRLGVNVVNLSISGVRDEAVEAVIAAMAKRGIIFVAAAGNDGPNGMPSYPAAYPAVIAVTAVNKDLIAYRNATRGDYIDLAAPGVNIFTALPNMRMGYRTGTSFAVPFVTSVMASLYASTPVKTKAALLRRLEFKDLGPAGRDPIYGRGLVMAPKDCTPPVSLRTVTAKAGGSRPADEPMPAEPPQAEGLVKANVAKPEMPPPADVAKPAAAPVTSASVTSH